MSRRRRQLAVRNPDVLLLLPLLARAHCHARIVETKAVDRSIYFVQVSRLSPQAARQHPSGGTDFRGVNLLCTKTGEDDYVPHFQQRRAGSSANLDSNGMTWMTFCWVRSRTSGFSRKQDSFLLMTLMKSSIIIFSYALTTIRFAST